MKEDIRKNTEEELRMEDFPDEPQDCLLYTSDAADE